MVGMVQFTGPTADSSSSPEPKKEIGLQFMTTVQEKNMQGRVVTDLRSLVLPSLLAMENYKKKR